MLTPKYKQNIIVGITYKNKFHWYILPITLAILNLDKLKPSTKNYYMSHTNFKNMRECCDNLNSESQVDEYIKVVKPFIISTEQLANSLAHASKSKKDFASDFCPSFYINFDECEFYYSDTAFSIHTSCLPNKFIRKQQNFLEIIPRKHQFWKLI